MMYFFVNYQPNHIFESLLIQATHPFRNIRCYFCNTIILCYDSDNLLGVCSSYQEVTSTYRIEQKCGVVHIRMGSRSTCCKVMITEQSTFVMKYFFVKKKQTKNSVSELCFFSKQKMLLWRSSSLDLGLPFSC